MRLPDSSVWVVPAPAVRWAALVSVWLARVRSLLNVVIVVADEIKAPVTRLLLRSVVVVPPVVPASVTVSVRLVRLADETVVKT